MGTGSIVRFRSKGNSPLVAFSHHYDGYPYGVGLNLAKFLKKREIVTGLGFNQSNLIPANGVDCLSAQYCAQFKTGPGGMYICPTDLEYEWNYDVIVDGYDILVAMGKTIYTVDEFIKYCSE